MYQLDAHDRKKRKCTCDKAMKNTLHSSMISASFINSGNLILCVLIYYIAPFTTVLYEITSIKVINSVNT